MRTRHAIMFRLSNKIVQVCFQDKTEIILSSESRVVTYCNKKGERMNYPLSTALEMQDYEMTKRLEYTKDILIYMLENNKQKKFGKDSKEEMINSQNLEPKLTMNEEKICGKASEKIKVDTQNNFPLKIENIDAIKNEEDEIEENEEIEEDEEDEEDVYIKFISMDQSIKDFGVRCQKSEKLVKIKKFLIKQNPQLKNKKIYFLGNGNKINDNKTIEENKIKNNDVLMIAEM